MTRETYEWANLWWEHAEDFTSPRVIVIGDSITNGYHGPLQARLRDKGVMVDKYAGSRGIGDEAFFRELEYVLGPHQGYTYKIIHFNNGLHGGHLGADEYERGYRRAIKLIRELHPEATLMLAASTSITPKESAGKIDEAANRQVFERNAVVERLAREYALPYDELFTVAAGKFPQPDTVHFTPEGYEALADAAAKRMSEFLE